MDWEQKQKAAEAWVKPLEAENMHLATSKALSNAMYSFSEMHLLKMDVDCVDPEAALRIWAIVEKVKQDGTKFPSELRM